MTAEVAKVLLPFSRAKGRHPFIWPEVPFIASLLYLIPDYPFLFRDNNHGLSAAFVCLHP